MKKKLVTLLILLCAFMGFVSAQFLEYEDSFDEYNDDDFFEFVAVEVPDVSEEPAVEETHEEESLQNEASEVQDEMAENLASPEMTEPVESTEITEAMDDADTEAPAMEPAESETAVTPAEEASEEVVEEVVEIVEVDSQLEESLIQDVSVETKEASLPEETVSQEAAAEETGAGEPVETPSVPEMTSSASAESAVAETSITAAAPTERTALETSVTAAPDEEPVPAEVIEESEEEVDEMAPSRTAIIRKRQYLDVTYPGEGWLYLGDENNSKTLSYKGREQKGNKTVFKFYSDRSGTALLHFIRQDSLSGEYVNDYLLVEIQKTSGNRERIDAPEYIPVIKTPEAIEENVEAEVTEEASAAETTESEEVASEETASEGTSESEELEEGGESEESEEAEPEVPEEPEIQDIIIDTGITFSDEPDVVFSFGDGSFFMGEGFDDDEYYQTLIDEANDAYLGKRYAEGIEKTQTVIDDGSYFSDEAYYIQAQIYEAASEYKDIEKAYQLYKMVVNYYPESSFWNKASKRVTYLEKNYIKVR